MGDPSDRSDAVDTAAGVAVECWRNIGIVAHINAGKTTLSERVLFDSGRQRFCGDVDAGTATMDWQREEQERGISIDAAVTDVAWRGYRIQIIDTPGHVDFTAEVERSLRILDGAIVVVDAVRGVESQTESVWRLLDRLEVPRLVFVNKLDRAAADYHRTIDSLVATFGCRAVPIVSPLFTADGALDGLVDAVAGHHQVWDRAAPSAAEIDAIRQPVLDACADLDERVLESFVAEGAVDPARLQAALQRGTQDRTIVPVFAGSALRNRGIEPLLDGVCRYLPSPLERRRDHAGPADEPLVAFVFKALQPEARFGQPLPLARVFRGELTVGAELELAADRTRARVRGLFTVHGFERTPVQRAGPGAVVGVEVGVPMRSGETLRSPGTEVELERIEFSEPVLSMRIEPAAAADLEELRRISETIAEVDPTLRIGRDPATGSLLVSGMGELHLDVYRERLERHLGRPARFDPPTVRCSETVTRPADGAAQCERALGEHRIRAAAAVHVEPAPEQGVVLRWAVAEVPAAVSREEVFAALGAAAESGLHRPVPARDVAVEVTAIDLDGPAEMAQALLVEAIELAVRRAFAAAAPKLLEPRVRFVVEVPTDSVSTVLADLRSRCARIEEVLPELGVTWLRGSASLARLLGYATKLRSMTRGRARFELAPDGFGPVEPS